jgi:hypothetical protein
MMQRFILRQPSEEAYRRNPAFAIEVLDGVTLERVRDGIEVIAVGLDSKPFINGGGVFVWRRQNIDALQAIRIDAGRQPYEDVTIERANLTLPPKPRPLTSIVLSPRANYPFAAGTTGIRGRLIATTTPPQVGVAGAGIRLRWLDDDGVTWRDVRQESRTTATGDFVSVLRLALTDVPRVINGSLTVRVRATRNSITRFSAQLQLPQGRVADPTTLNSILAWDALQP